MVYLLHFDSPISENHTTQHYIGYADDVNARIKEHKAGHGARLTQVANERGIGFEVVRIWEGDRKYERQLKNRKNAPRLCPICKAIKEGQHELV
jgi:predicted GIY-YIG superfamily endonuclease